MTDVLAGQGGHGNGPLIDVEKPLDHGRFGDVDLVENENLWDPGRSDLVEHVANGDDLAVGVWIIGIDDVDEEVRVRGLVEG